MANAIEVCRLAKSYGNVEAVKGIDFYVEEGTLFAFLGPNGAGKSTTIDMLTTILKPDAGEVIIDSYRLGQDDEKIRAELGIVFQHSVLDNQLTVRENLLIRGSLYGLSKSKLQAGIDFAVEATAITNFLDRPYGKLSGGQRRRVDVARALLNTPRILILDEPTTGLDPQTRERVWDTIQGIQRSHGMTVFLTTHYMEEAAKADYVVVIDEGQIAAQGTPAELKERFTADYLILHSKETDQLAAVLDQLGCEHELAAGGMRVKLDNTLAALPILQECHPLISSFQVIQGSMDDAFINIIGRELRE